MDFLVAGVVGMEEEDDDFEYLEVDFEGVTESSMLLYICF